MNSSTSVTQLRMQTGLRIRRERILWGMTQEQLSAVLGVSANYLGQIERGNRDLSRKMEDRLCSLFHLDRNELHMTDSRDFSGRVCENDLLMPHLQEDDILRMLNSCSPEELYLCGHVLRSMLMYLRRPVRAAEDLPVRNEVWHYSSADTDDLSNLPEDLSLAGEPIISSESLSQ